MDLTPEQRIQYAAIIDTILRESDLNTISEKKIRRALADKLGYDVSHQKAAISTVIMERFDNISKTTPPTSADDSSAARPTKASNSHTATKANGTKPSVPTPKSEDDSEAEARPPPKKKQRKQQPDSDAKLAALLQAEENSRGRPSRGSVNRKPVAPRKRLTAKQKSARTVRADDDSELDLDSAGEKKVKVLKGGFHKQYLLSEPLTHLVGETRLSRPQVVKKIWEHIKALNLQDPADKRQILCDDKMYAVFRQDKVHMFTMNKLLGRQLYPIEGEEGEDSGAHAEEVEDAAREGEAI